MDNEFFHFSKFPDILKIYKIRKLQIVFSGCIMVLCLTQTGFTDLFVAEKPVTSQHLNLKDQDVMPLLQMNKRNCVFLANKSGSVQEHATTRFTLYLQISNIANARKFSTWKKENCVDSLISNYHYFISYTKQRTRSPLITPAVKSFRLPRITYSVKNPCVSPRLHNKN